jgi:hypothetical protein
MKRTETVESLLSEVAARLEAARQSTERAEMLDHVLIAWSTLDEAAAVAEKLRPPIGTWAGEAVARSRDHARAVACEWCEPGEEP